jgi:hypothetical protein
MRNASARLGVILQRSAKNRERPGKELKPPSETDSIMREPDMIERNRRSILQTSSIALMGAVALPLAACSDDEKEVGAVEDLMREHGVLRRVLLVYAEAAPKLRTSVKSIDTRSLNRGAKLLQTFGEDYHEKNRKRHTSFRG